jgi:hypothetical protein
VGGGPCEERGGGFKLLTEGAIGPVVGLADVGSGREGIEGEGPSLVG